MSSLVMTIYALLDPHNECVRYIGVTKRTPEQRLHSHLKAAKAGSTYRVHNWMRKIVVKPLLRVIELCDERSWSDAERRWIAHYRSLGCELTNITGGGEGTFGTVASAETRAKMSNVRIGNTNANGNTIWLGRKHKEESKQKMAEARRGTTASEDTKRKMSLSRIGNKYSLGVVPSAETRSKISAAGIGRKASPEAKARMSVAQKLRFQREKLESNQ